MFMDDPLVGRYCIGVSFIPFFSDHILIEKRKLTYIGSYLSTKRDGSFDLDYMRKFLLLKTELSPWKEDHKVDLYARAGTDAELYIVDANNKRFLLIPKFTLNFNIIFAENSWKRFINKLCKYSDLPLEEVVETEKISD